MTVELSWVERTLPAIDRLTGDVAVGSLFEDERPPRGFAGLVDWRMSGRLSSLCLSSFLTGATGELFLAPVRPRLPFDGVLLIGLGARRSFDETAYRAVLAKLLDALAGLRVRRAVLELPGRHADAVPAARAFEMLRALLAETDVDLEAMTLLDDPEAQRAYADAQKAATRVRK